MMSELTVSQFAAIAITAAFLAGLFDALAVQAESSFRPFARAACVMVAAHGLLPALFYIEYVNAQVFHFSGEVGLLCASAVFAVSFSVTAWAVGRVVMKLLLWGFRSVPEAASEVPRMQAE